VVKHHQQRDEGAPAVEGRDVPRTMVPAPLPFVIAASAGFNHFSNAS